jgi:hypothetical protein
VIGVDEYTRSYCDWKRVRQARSGPHSGPYAC